jgi:hypothetical protein
MDYLVPMADIDFLITNKSAPQIASLVTLLVKKANEKGAANSFSYLVEQILSHSESVKFEGLNQLDLLPELEALSKDWTVNWQPDKSPTNQEIQIFESMLMLHDFDWRLGQEVSRNERLHAPVWFYLEILKSLSEPYDNQPSSHQALAFNESVPTDILQMLWDKHDITNGGAEQLDWAIASNKNCPQKLLTELALSKNHIWVDYYYTWADGISEVDASDAHEGFVKYQVANNPSSSKTILESILDPTNNITQEDCLFEEQNGITKFWAFEINAQIHEVVKNRLNSK